MNILHVNLMVFAVALVSISDRGTFLTHLSNSFFTTETIDCLMPGIFFLHLEPL